MKIAVPDLISNSYFPAVAAVELGMFARFGLDMTLELIYPVDKTYEALARGEIDLVAGSAHSAVAAFPEWKGVKLLCAQSQGMYWFLVVRADLPAHKGDLSVVKGLTIGAAPWVDMGLKMLLRDAGIDAKALGVDIIPVPGTARTDTNFGLTAAEALARGDIDAFWANGMGAEVAVRRGVGKIALDVRRGDGPRRAFNYTMPVIAARDELVEAHPDRAEASVRAIRETQKLLKEDVALATKVGNRLFPPFAAGLIADVVARDLPFYEPRIDASFVETMNTFLRAMGALHDRVGYRQVVADMGLD